MFYVLESFYQAAFKQQQLKLIIGIVLLTIPVVSNAACPEVVANQNPLEVRREALARIAVCPEKVLREQLPATMFGFNVQHYFFERDIWNSENKTVPGKIVSELSEFPGALYRYPGGLVANRFAWQKTVGPLSEREKQKSVKWDLADKVRFGVDEYLNFVASVKGQPWFVLNLVGWDSKELFTELDSKLVAETNAELARHFVEKLGAGTPHYYQLGNELDRADYQWTHEKYITRARDTIEAMQKIDPDARFVAFLREFDWTYKGAEKARGKSLYPDFIRDVLTALPMVNDFSMHFYYDARDSEKKYQKIPWRLRQFQRAIEVATEVRDGVTPNVWITEHARGINFGKIKVRDARPYTSNLAAALSTSDFLIALAQIPNIQGASWHGMNALPWQLFDPENQLKPNPVYWALRVLQSNEVPRVLATYTRSPNQSGYAGGYDHRAVVFGDQDNSRLGVWVVNRAVKPANIELRVDSWAKREVSISHKYIAGKTDQDPDGVNVRPIVVLDPQATTGGFSKHGSLVLELPPNSVSAFTLTKM